MTELQILAVQQIALGLAAYERDHLLISSGEIKLETDDAYDVQAITALIVDIEAASKNLCVFGGRPDLVGTGS
jgi:hypothetical protein